MKRSLTKPPKQEAILLLGNAVHYIQNAPLSVVFKRTGELNNQTGIRGEDFFIKLMKVKNAFPPLIHLFFVKRNLINENKLFFKEGIIHENEFVD